MLEVLTENPDDVMALKHGTFAVCFIVYEGEFGHYLFSLYGFYRGYSKFIKPPSSHSPKGSISGKQLC